MEWSHYSEALFEAYLHTDDNIIVQACPGAGKTTNIKHLWGLTDKKTLYLVFNKHNQLEAESKLPVKASSAVKTLNGLGHSILLNNYGSVTLDDRKVRGIVRGYMPMPRKYSKDVAEKQYTLIKAVQTAKMFATTTFTADAFAEMISLYDMDEYDGMLDDVVACLYISDSDTWTIDYNDQIRLPALTDLHMPVFDDVLGDEVQDFSPIQTLLVRKLQAQRYVLVGDRHQSIYGFRGAMNNSMEHLRQWFDATALPLSITYRCPVSVVKEAYNIFPDIEAWSESAQGIVRTGDISTERIDADTLVLCRINRPLIALAYKLLSAGVPCHVWGRDIGQGLTSLIKKQQASNVSKLLDKLAFWYEFECVKAQRKEDEGKLQRLSDRYESVLLFCNKCKLTDSPDCVIQQIESLFEQGKGACLSTVHKAKGLEADKCVLLETDLFNTFKVRQKQAWQREQESNILYVAVTRAKRELVYA